MMELLALYALILLFALVIPEPSWEDKNER